ncbi:MAG: hypothetical protein ACI9DC_001947 [Gammaproteobacteria bacterium]
MVSAGDSMKPATRTVSGARTIARTIVRFAAPALALSLMSLLALSARAQWTDVGSTRAVTQLEAVVRSDTRAELRIWLDDEQALRLQFKLTPGLVSFAPQSCITLQVDEQPIQDLSAPEHECSSDGGSVQLLLTQVEGEQVDSPTLLDLMNGKKVNLRYRLEHAGYGTEQFSLKGSKQALSDTLGADIRIIRD